LNLGATPSTRFFRSEGITVLETPDPRTAGKPLADRFVRTVRTECLYWVLILGRRHFEHVLRIYTAYDKVSVPIACRTLAMRKHARDAQGAHAGYPTCAVAEDAGRRIITGC
jgi:hypothetical protein